MILFLPASLLACSSPTPDAPRTEAPPTQINSVATPKRTKIISPQIPSPRILNAQNCVTSIQVTVTASKPFVTVSYIEPTTKANGQALTNLAKTTIYQDLGKGLVKYKDIKATNPAGGGTIREKISFSLKPEETLHATICVSATDTNGREG